MLSSFTTVSLRRPSIRGRAMDFETGVTKLTQYEDSCGVSTGTSMISRRLPSIPAKRTIISR